MNRIFAKTRVFALSISEETMNDASFVRFDTISECDRQTGGHTDRETDGHLCYCNTSACMACYATVLVKIHTWAWAFWGRSPDSLPGLCFCIPLGDFRPRDSFASHHLTSNPESAPELGAAFSTPAFSTRVTWCRVFHSRVFHPCYLMPRFPLPRFQSTLVDQVDPQPEREFPSTMAANCKFRLTEELESPGESK